jgi:polyhydroxyalkanoate synthesis regulator phasin
MASIYSYFKTGKLSQYFDIQFDDDGNIESAEMKLGNLRKFIEAGLANGAFVGADWQHFDLSKDIDSLEKFKDAMGVTEEVAFAFIKSMEDHDIEWLNGDYSSMFEDILPDNLANDIYENTSALADLAVQLANGEITAEEYTKQWNELSEASQENAKKARENATAWIETSNDVEEAKTKVQELSNELDALYEQGASEAEIQLKTDELNEAKQNLTQTVDKLSKLETMDPVVLQVALDHAQTEIDAFEKENETLLAKVEIVQDAENGEFNYEVKAGIVLDENEKKQLEGYLEDVNAKYDFEGALDKEVVPYEDQLQSIESILQNIYDKMSGRGTADVKKTNDNGEAPESVDTSGLKEFFTTTLPEGLKELWGNIDAFFTETIPEKWSEFWDSVGDKFDEIKKEAVVLKEKVVDFFTTTVPEKWDEFWEEVGDKVDEIKKFAGKLKEKVDTFYNFKERF